MSTTPSSMSSLARDTIKDAKDAKDAVKESAA